MKLSFRCHPLTINFSRNIYIHKQVPIIQSSKKRMKDRSKSGNGSNLEDLVRPRFDYIAYNIQVYIWVVQYDSSSLINCSRKLESVAKSSSYGYLPTPWWPCRVERVRRHYLLVSLFFSPSPHTWCILLLETRASIIDANRPTRPSDNRFYVTHLEPIVDEEEF